jgi:hypothetical protein
MATPVVSATAALVISVIQRLTGNFTAHGAATKGFLISSADTPAAAAGAYSRRVNAARAVDAAVKAFTNAAGVPATAPLRAAWALPGAVPSGIEVAGVTEGYYWTPGTPGTSWQQRAPQDSSTRGASLPFGGFKYSTNMTVVITGNLRMDTAGETQQRGELEATALGSAFCMMHSEARPKCVDTTHSGGGCTTVTVFKKGTAGAVMAATEAGVAPVLPCAVLLPPPTTHPQASTCSA